jgi:acyl-CoA thioester hydrolase
MVARIFQMADPVLPAELAAHPTVITLPVQWGDQDAFGHVNNVIYFRWMESARIEYFRRGISHLMSNQGVGPILASIQCDFRRQLTYPDTLQVAASIRSIGRTSLQMAHLIYSTQQQAVAAEGHSVIVMFDYAAQRPTPVPDSIRQKIDALEGRA